MTATHDRRTDLDDVEPDVTPWTERPIVGAGRGLPWWGTVLLPFALATVGAVVDIQRGKAPGLIFEGLYLVSCVVAVCWARRRNVFGPTVQPPLILVITVPLTVLLAGGSPGGSGLTAKALSVATPLINSFPVMAITTALTVAIGLYRRIKQRNPYAAEERAARRRERAGRQREQAARQRASAAERRGTPARGTAAADRRGSSDRSAGSGRGGTGQRAQPTRGTRQNPPARGGGRPTPQPRRRRPDDDR